MATQTIPQIQGQKRSDLGSRRSRRLRDGGRLPAVIYGHRQEPVHVSLDRKELTDLLHRKAHLVEVAVGIGKESCLLKEVQWDHLGLSIIHVGLNRVDMTEEVTVEVDIELVGEAVGLKEGGAYLDHPASAVKIRCLAANIPESIQVQIGDLKVGDAITVGDLKLPAGVTAVDDPEMLIAAIHVAVEEVEVAAAVTAEAAEPEVIRKKEKEEAGEEEKK